MLTQATGKKTNNKKKKIANIDDDDDDDNRISSNHTSQKKRILKKIKHWFRSRISIFVSVCKCASINQIWYYRYIINKEYVFETNDYFLHKFFFPSKKDSLSGVFRIVNLKKFEFKIYVIVKIQNSSPKMWIKVTKWICMKCLRRYFFGRNDGWEYILNWLERMQRFQRKKTKVDKKYFSRIATKRKKKHFILIMFFG